MSDRKKYFKQYYIENREKILKYHRKWRKNNPNHNEQWRKDNPEKEKERCKKWYRDNRETELKKDKEWREKNPEIRRKWQRKNRRKLSEYQKRYLKTEKGKANIQRKNFKRWTTMKKVINTLTSQEWLDILKKHNYKCAYCGIKFDLFCLPTRDHKIPISKGGDNVKENIVPACRPCNSRKNNKQKGVITCGIGSSEL